ncbi:MAG: GntR family transcriptional regulator/MocR family aminotransferase [Alphaproteobacteria bacterium]|jgi:GntR family transcriptional regulator/MocR family aminotransferase
MRTLPFRIDRQNAAPLYRQIYDRFRDAFRSGSLRPGDHAPSSRSLASELGVARGTVEEAYALLAAEGYLRRDGRRGSIISPELSAYPRAIAATPAPADTLSGNNAAHPNKTSPFQLGVPALDEFPRKLWSRLTARQACGFGKEDMMYPDLCGYWPLRDAIAQYLALSRGIHCALDNVIITNGYQSGLDLALQVLLKAGDEVWLEDPGYFRAQQAVLNSTAQLVPLRVDEAGLRVEDGVAQARDARLAIVTPSHHSPTCVAMSLPRRLALLSWASTAGSWIIEDDYDGEFHYSGKKLPALKSLDTDGRVLYAGSFSKTLFPSLRLGYLVAPDALLADLVQTIQFRNAGAATLPQAITAQFMIEGHFTRHLKRMRNLYARRRSALAEALGAVFPDTFNIQLTGGGMNIIARLPTHIRDTVLVERAAVHGIALYALSTHALSDRGDNALIFGFTNVPEENAGPLAQQLKNILT